MKNPSCLRYVGDYTTQLFGNYDIPLKGSLLSNQYVMESKEEVVFFSWLTFWLGKKNKLSSAT